MKPCLVYDPTDIPSFITPWMRPVVEQYFDIQPFDPAVTYDKHRHISLITHIVYYCRPEALAPLKQRNHAMIIDHLWDSDVAKTTRKIAPLTLMLHCPNWMWYHSNREFRYLGHANYRPNSVNTHSFLMLMHNVRWHRDRALGALHSVLNTALYSYMQRNVYLADDTDCRDNENWSRHLNPSWYDRTNFSVVVESYMRNSRDNRGMRTEVSEKLFKPMAYEHPFVVYGSVDTLKYLEDQGFATFDNLFDPSYDSIEDDDLRFEAVTQQILSAVDRWHRGELGRDAETLRRTKHNRDHFYQDAWVLEQIKKEIIFPMLEHVNA